MSLPTSQINFPFIHVEHQKGAFLFLIVATLLVFSALQIINSQIITDAAPSGIVSYELAYSQENFESIHQSWSEQQFRYAALSLGFDYLFLVLYPITIALGIVMLSNKLGYFKIGKALAWLVISAGVLDAIENYSLIQLLTSHFELHWAHLSFWAASIKFTIVGIGLLYLIVGVGISLARKSSIKR
ncbi:MAG: hypothetical protein WC967_02565 [Balneolaceae bacterium]